MAKNSVDRAATRWLGQSLNDLEPAERRVIESAVSQTTIARDVNQSVVDASSFGDRVADSIARVGGSWSFILGFLTFLALWVLANTILLSQEAFDPYPFIFLNLVLSMVAALQAPIIMMSQNRSAERDRIDAGHDYEINLKAEIEILALHEKVDALRQVENARMEATLATILDRLTALERHLAKDGAAS
ncbi:MULTISPECIES: DUF1003 domain-containing protein [unclassified Aureimonas]|uniref:DUF1003 domain-containing protein n=1 Tax=unclassified Aureimonas TaxID=2615206 RepID=UPI0006FD4189|nr:MULTISPECIES: DUF1003 domain-containing protein [unclassified Aureimonas]KQT57396.1 cyclic nucleotide-binding protein [Aureimonas sp. Leaf427]KQT77074.1 cyclic nucleotide-binding protein [Aureimonas sp. Leaf460]